MIADETRPVLQGARLTAWELMQDNIPVTLITDNMAGSLMRQGLIHLCVVGADRIAANGDVANKIGTYSVAVLARAHNIPFYVAAPYSTIDLRTASGNDIPSRNAGRRGHVGIWNRHDCAERRRRPQSCLRRDPSRIRYCDHYRARCIQAA